MTTGPFELESRNEEYSHTRAPGSLVTLEARWSGLAVGIIIKDEFYSMIWSADKTLKFSDDDIAIVIACTKQSFDGRPSWRAHYLLTPDAVGWYVSNPELLITQARPCCHIPTR